MKLIRNLLRHKFFITSAIFITFFIAYLSLIKIPSSKVSIANIDKIYHLIAYFTLSIFWLFSFYKRKKLKYIIVTLCVLYGIIIEILQDKFTAYRTGDYKDVIANTLGVLLALVMFNLILKKNVVN